MDNFFFDFSIPDHCKVRLAEKTLKGEAAKWWEEELETVDYYGEPNHTWSSMKLEMYEEFVKNAASQKPSRQVLRTKLFEEGENDTESESAGKTPKHHSERTSTEIIEENSKENLSIISSHLESPSKKNHPIITSDEGHMNFTIQVISRPPVSDICSVILMQRPIQKELSCKPSWYEILIQFRRFEKSFHTKPRSDVRVIDFTNKPDSDFVKLDLPVLFGELRSDQRELWNKVNCFEILTHQERFEAWNHINQSFNEGVMDFTSQGNLQWPYLEAHEIGGNQGCDWRPEDFLIHLEAARKTPRCILIHWIHQFQSIPPTHQDFPSQAHGTSNVIKSQQLFPKTHGRPRCLLGLFLDVPRHSSYGPKLSRLKTKNGRFLFLIF